MDMHVIVLIDALKVFDEDKMRDYEFAWRTAGNKGSPFKREVKGKIGKVKQRPGLAASWKAFKDQHNKQYAAKQKQATVRKKETAVT